MLLKIEFALIKGLASVKVRQGSTRRRAPGKDMAKIQKEGAHNDKT